MCAAACGDKKETWWASSLWKDLLYAFPSPRYEPQCLRNGYLLSKFKVEEIMTSKVISISPSAPLEEAARVMVDKDGVAGRGRRRLVGIITETGGLQKPFGIAGCDGGNLS